MLIMLCMLRHMNIMLTCTPIPFIMIQICVVCGWCIEITGVLEFRLKLSIGGTYFVGEFGQG